MGEPDDGRRVIAAGYLRGRTLEEALAAWRSDYDAPTYRERRPMLARLGTLIRRLAAEGEARAEAAADLPGKRRRAGAGGRPSAAPNRQKEKARPLHHASGRAKE